ncbi:MAG: hypothetical protein GX891_04075 [Clostridiales bacterium]|nr:hypothetical protein [Clostridiales bacterium]
MILFPLDFEAVTYDEDLSRLICQIEGVTSCVYVANQEVGVLAVLTEPLLLRSSRKKLIEEIEAALSRSDLKLKRIAVTFSPELYGKCLLDPTDEEINGIYSAALKG